MISTHTRFESAGSASTVADFISQAKKLGRKYIAYTDISKMTSIYKAYKEAESQEIGFIPGCEMHFRSSEGSIFKYFSITAYAHDQIAFQTLANIVSHPKEVRNTDGDFEIPVFDIAQIVPLKGKNVSFNFHGVHSLAFKLLASNKEAQLDNVLKFLKEIGPVSVSVVAAKEDAILEEKIAIGLQNKEVLLGLKDTLDIDVFIKGKFKRLRIRAKDLIDSEKNDKPISTVYPNGIKISIKPETPKYVRTKNVLTKRDKCLNTESNQALVEFAKKNNLEILVSDNAYMATPNSKGVQDAKLQGERLEVEDLYMLSKEECVKRLVDQGFTHTDSHRWIDNTDKWVEGFKDFKLEYNWRLPSLTNDVQGFLDDLIKKVGRMDWGNPEYVERYNYEMSIIRDNGVFDFSPYFVPIASVFEEYKSAGLITGPGRGSLASSLVGFLCGFTHVNPLEYDLDFNRFFSMDRVKTRKIPDADCDLQSRELLVGENGDGGLLKRMMGDKYAQISTRGNLRLKSSIQTVARSFNDGVVPPDILKISNNLPNPPQGGTDRDFVFGYEDSDGNHIKGLIEIDETLQDYVAKYPDQWAVVSEMLGVSHSIGRHASAFVLTDIPVSEIVPTMTVKGHGPVTQYEAKEVESAGLIKYDFLVVKALKDIQDCIDLINKRDSYKDEAGYFMHNGQRTFVWDLPQNDTGVIKVVKSGNYASAFQVSTETAIPLTMKIQPRNIEDFAVILALGRPGPLGFIDDNTGRNMAEEYIYRRNGLSETDLPALKDSLPDTYGTIVYQEDLSRISKVVGKMSGERAEILRDHMCKKREKKMMEMKPEFMAGAIETVGEENAEKIWSQMKTFANYGFSRPHAISYAHTTYATFFLKAHYPLEWWASVLSNADSKEIKENLWKHVKYIVTPPDINMSEEKMLIDYNTKTIRNKLSTIKGLSEAGVSKLVSGRPYKDLQHIVDSKTVGDAMLKKLMHVGVLDSLLPDHNISLVNKMTLLQDAINKREYNDKLEELKKKEIDYLEGRRKTKPKSPKEPEPALPDEEYLTMSPYQDILIRKTLMPSVEIDLTNTVSKVSDKVDVKITSMSIKNPQGKTNEFVDGYRMRELEKEGYEPEKEYTYYACAGIVLSAKEFTYSNGENRALKMLVDTDGYEREVVIWPDYNTKELSYPDNLVEGSIVLLYYSRNRVKPRAYLNSVVVEFSPKK